MSLSAAALQLLLDKGMTLADAIELAGVIEEGFAAPAPTVNALRQRRFRERKAETVTNNVTSNADPRPLPSSPQTPQQPTPTPGDITTRATREREAAAFDRFWTAYPRKVCKADARKAFTKAWRKLPPMDEEAILTGGLERAKAAWTDAQFIPHAATWLSGERWQDEPGEVIQLQPRKAPHERPHRDAKFAARQANLATLERGADIAARFHGKP